jgi:hypothetical protein
MGRRPVHRLATKRNLRFLAVLLGGSVVVSLLTPIGPGPGRGRDHLVQNAVADSPTSTTGLTPASPSDLAEQVGGPAGPATPPSTSLCGRDDTPETGIQGDMSRADQESRRADEGYNCGLMVVGHHDLGGLGGGALGVHHDARG